MFIQILHVSTLQWKHPTPEFDEISSKIEEYFNKYQSLQFYSMPCSIIENFEKAESPNNQLIYKVLSVSFSQVILVLTRNSISFETKEKQVLEDLIKSSFAEGSLFRLDLAHVQIGLSSIFRFL